MKQFSAQYIFTNTGKPVKRGIVTTDDHGKIVQLEDTGGSLGERHSVEFHNGIIMPGFVNCHCHLELSHLKGLTAKGSGLGIFIEQIRSNRENDADKIADNAKDADDTMSREGVVLCADICNTASTFGLKQQSRIKYINLLEVFGIDKEKAGKRIAEIMKVAEACKTGNLPFSIVPHSVYSTSLTLFRLLHKLTTGNTVTSVHFMESAAEVEFLSHKSGSIAQSYIKSGLMPSIPDTVESHAAAVLREVTSSGNLILVHNTYAGRETVDQVNTRGNTYWCLCPGSNLYIEGKLPPVNVLKEADCRIVIGTDSLASNTMLSILNEMRLLQDNFHFLTLDEIIGWATINGAMALNESKNYGSIEPGKTPGLILLENLDLEKMRLIPETHARRLI